MIILFDGRRIDIDNAKVVELTDVYLIRNNSSNDAIAHFPKDRTAIIYGPIKGMTK